MSNQNTDAMRRKSSLERKPSLIAYQEGVRGIIVWDCVVAEAGEAADEDEGELVGGGKTGVSNENKSSGDVGANGKDNPEEKDEDENEEEEDDDAAFDDEENSCAELYF